MIKRVLFLLFGCFCSFTFSMAQIDDDNKADVLTGINQDTTLIRIDSAELKNQAKPIDDPLKAALLSAVLPGLGQAYNGSYWKIPIIYAGFVGFGATIHYMNYYYITYRNALSAELDGKPHPFTRFNYGERRLNLAVESTRRNRDFTMILTGLFYMLQIVEANVDGHLKTFDISDEISLNLDPHIGQIAQNYHLGLSLKLNLK